MQRRHALLALATCALLVGGCSSARKRLKSLVPQDADTYARTFLHTWCTEGFEQANKRFNLELKPSDSSAANLEPLAQALAKGEAPLAVQTVGSQVLFVGDVKQAYLTYQLEFSDAWVLVGLVVETEAGQHWISHIHVDPLDQPLAAQPFTFADLEVVHYVALAAGVLITVFGLYVLVVCLFTRNRLKLLWVIVILLGVGRMSINWTTGDCGYDYASVQLPWITAMKVGPHSPWVLNLGFPLGALLFYLKRWWADRAERRRRAPKQPRPQAQKQPPPEAKPQGKGAT